MIRSDREYPLMSQNEAVGTLAHLMMAAVTINPLKQAQGLRIDISDQ